MEAIATRPALACCRQVVTSGVRHASTAIRIRRALRIPPHPSFLNSGSDRQTTDDIIYNPPSSAASTPPPPLIIIIITGRGPFPSIEGAPRYKARHHLTKADIEEMRRLRAEDPATNTVQALSARFRCSKLFVMMCCQAPKEHKEKVRAELERRALHRCLGVVIALVLITSATPILSFAVGLRALFGSTPQTPFTYLPLAKSL
ncbi:hypothetical protein VTH06DRAFT_6440 [Thermothelomyces fergusii]